MSLDPEPWRRPPRCGAHRGRRAATAHAREAVPRASRRRSSWPAGRAHLAREADLAEDQRARRDRALAQRAGDAPPGWPGRRRGRPGARRRRPSRRCRSRPGPAPPASRGSPPAARPAWCPRPAPPAAACRRTSGRPAPAPRPGRCATRCARRTPPRPARRGAAGQEQRAGVVHGHQSLAAHLEHRQLAGGAEAVLDRAHQADRPAAVALEVEDGVDHVLEQLRSGQVARLGHVPDQEHGTAVPPREVGQRARRRRGSGSGSRDSASTCSLCSVCTESAMTIAGPSRPREVAPERLDQRLELHFVEDQEARPRASGRSRGARARMRICAGDSSPAT